MVKITYKTGDMFQENAQAIINTVNCVGVMGKGVALEFKRRWKFNFDAYKKACDNGTMQVGKILVVKNKKQYSLLEENTNENTEQDFEYLLNFPTKNHWRSKSKIEYITDGMDDLISVIKKHNITNIVIPPLGCGNGQLDWNTVKQIIIDRLSTLDDTITAIIYEPIGYTELYMTPKRAIMLKTFSELEWQFGGMLTHLCMQKIVYFMQCLNKEHCNYNIQFAKDKYGPFSKKLQAIFETMEHQKYIINFTKGECVVSASAIAESNEYLKNNSLIKIAEDIVQKMQYLFDGYTSPFGAELLSTVHYCYIKDPNADIIQSVHAWSDRKYTLFKPAMITVAKNRLHEDKII